MGTRVLVGGARPVELAGWVRMIRFSGVAQAEVDRPESSAGLGSAV